MAKLRSTKILGTMLFLGLISGADDPDPGKATDVPQRFARLDYSPEAGDRSSLESDHDIALCTDFFAYQDYWKASKAGDSAGQDEVVARGKVVRVRSGTKILVIKVHDFGGASDAPRPAEVRVLDGPQSGKAAWVPQYRIEQMVSFPARVAEEAALDASGFTDGLCPVASGSDAFNLYAAARRKGDLALIRGLEATKKLAWAGSGVRIRVKAICIDRGFQRDFGLESEGILVEFVGGPLNGKPAWVFPDSVAKVAADTRLTAAKSKSLEAKARALLNVGKNLENAGKPDEAIEHYRRVVEELGETAAAKEAAGRIKALED